ncbi:nucleotidyl transferase AbiEii/AbiGii toxin family protein [Pediococcus parvulus]|uniref:nucleotidyl transferase AbiEii/AbiGii toxin family protein n=1 Tax=Pediococcus parvulus TaxID=54062 RepID=UPI0021A55C30|nr:nucleotidyl transferase AbiEii/AbiGii toxin family protein [Pediococcus parvulus]MCT3034864.1 nucleotidyl transferase AbiEii/AbiGii toxin family protein [Pediococcus parvulus]
MKLDFSDKKQFLAKIRKKASQRKISPQILLQEVVLDDILDRIAHSEYRDNLVLKGGFLIASLIGTDTRSTRDIDTSIVGLPVTKETMKKVFEDVCAIELPNDIIQLTIVKLDDIREDDEYSGYRMHVKAKVYSSVVNVKIDISTGDVITERAIIYGHKLLLEDRTIQVMAYNLETIVAEKLETIVNRAFFNTRLKDYYDLYLFDRQSVKFIDFDLLRKAIYATSENRGTSAKIGDYVETINTLKLDSNLSQLWQAYQERNNYAKGILFVDTCDAAIDLTKKSGIG